jgi:hypothetical protein
MRFTHILSMAPSWSVIDWTNPCIAFMPCTVSGWPDGYAIILRPRTAGPTASRQPMRLHLKMVRLISCAL